MIRVITYILLILFSAQYCQSQNIAINTTGAANSSLSMLEILELSTTANSKGLYISHSGALAGGVIGYALQAIKTGATGINVAGYFSATGGGSNYSIIVPSGGGNVGIGTTTPGDLLEINGNILFTKEAARTFKVAASTTANAAGGALTISAGNGAAASGGGGALNLNGGTPLGFGGGGSVNITTAAGFASGSINLTGGNGGLGGGAINLTAGGSTVAAWPGSSIGITAGTASGASTLAGSVNITGGAASGTTSAGGSIYLTPGVGTIAGSQVKIVGGFATQRTATAASASTDNEVIVGVTNTAAPRTITLVNENKLSGRIIIIKDESGTAATNNITITPATGTIDGAANVVIATNYGSFRLYSDGTNWFTF